MKSNNVASRRAFLEQMPTWELDEMLQDELHKDNIDDALVRLILDVLEEREADHPIENDEEVTAAVEKYTAYIDGIEVTPAKPSRIWGMALKVASVLLVVGLLFCIVPQVVNAESFFEMLARWTDSIFTFFSPGDDNKQPEYVFETDNPDLQKIYDVVVELGMTEPVVPMWVPEGYELKTLYVLDQTVDTTILAGMSNGENYILYNMLLHSEKSMFKYEKDSQTVKIIEVDGIEHYVMMNLDERLAVWINNNAECSIVTDCQDEVLYKILKSIYMQED